MRGNRGGRDRRQESGAWLVSRRPWRAAVVVALGFFLYLVPGFAGTPRIGVARLTGTAVRNGAPLPNGSIVYSGDAVRTGQESTLQLAASAEERLWFGPDTSAKVAQEGGYLVVALDRGTMGFASRGRVRVAIAGREFSLGSPSASPVLARLAYVNGEEAQLWIEKGSLEVEQNGRAVVLEASRHGLTSVVGGEPAARAPARETAGRQVETSQGRVNGKVVNTDLQPVSQATITLTSATGTTYTARSAGDGTFVFNNLPPGTYTLSVSVRGYTTYKQELKVVAGGESSLYVELKGQGAGAAAAGGHKALIIGVIGGAAAAGLGTGFAVQTSKKASPSSF